MSVVPSSWAKGNSYPLSNFPGKFRLERRLVSRPAVGRALNRIRRLAGRPELEIPATAD
jgi:hypothetical protein